ncbi:IS1595 family transposase [Hyphococcus sp.]|jgi:transposase-like protein|uniref:IS1595 family transposase n=1 Tax=Hyphococcus sp. TaxID=2038636 RepID=UPI003D0C5DC0
MAQHFLLSKAAKTLSLIEVFKMTDEEIERIFAQLRWPETQGEAACVHCGSLKVWDCRRPSGAPRYRCADCGKDFSITSGTLFASHKLSLRIYLAAILMFCNEVKGKSMLAMSRELGVTYRCAFVLCHKLREAMSVELKDRAMGGEGIEAEIDGAYFGGYVKPENMKKDRRDRRFRINQSGKRRCVVVVREREGNTTPMVFQTEAEATNWIKRRVDPATILHADEAPSWNGLHARFEVRRVNHEVGFSYDFACTNQAESFFSRLRRAEQGHHHWISGPYLLRYAQEAAWREDNRRKSNGHQVNRVIGLALNAKQSVDFTCYGKRAA